MKQKIYIVATIFAFLFFSLTIYLLGYLNGKTSGYEEGYYIGEISGYEVGYIDGEANGYMIGYSEATGMNNSYIEI